MAKRQKDNDFIWNWFEHNLDMDTRTIYMGSVAKDSGDYETGVDNFMAEYFIKGMHLLETKNSEDEINIVMNNPGGDWYHGMAIYDAIKNSTCYCNMKVYGHAMSMGSIILQSAHNRVMMPNSRFMIHYGYNGSSGHTKIFEKWADEGKRLNYLMENIYLDSMLDKEEKEGHGHMSKVLTSIVTKQRALEIPHPGEISYKFSKSPSAKREEIRVILRELLNFDTILTAEETVQLGFADSVYSVE